jgi:hypothetical protein
VQHDRIITQHDWIYYAAWNYIDHIYGHLIIALNISTENNTTEI